MVDPDGVAKLNGIQKLEEDVLDQCVVTNETALFGDVRKQVAFRAVLNDNKGAVWTVQDAH